MLFLEKYSVSFCVICSSLFQLTETPLCEFCRNELLSLPLQRRRLSGQTHYYLIEYTEISSRLIRSTKNGRNWRLSRWLGALLARKMLEMDSGLLESSNAIVTPPPSHPRVLGKFDHAAQMAVGASAVLGMPFQFAALNVERSPGGSQKGKARAERCLLKTRLGHQLPKCTRYLFIDDVLTTGSTLAAAAQTLKPLTEEGSRAVTALTFAYTKLA